MCLDVKYVSKRVLKKFLTIGKSSLVLKVEVSKQRILPTSTLKTFHQKGFNMFAPKESIIKFLTMKEVSK